MSELHANIVLGHVGVHGNSGNGDGSIVDSRYGCCSQHTATEPDTRVSMAVNAGRRPAEVKVHHVPASLPTPAYRNRPATDGRLVCYTPGTQMQGFGHRTTAIPIILFVHIKCVHLNVCVDYPIYFTDVCCI